MKVRLISYTQCPEAVVAAAARVCYDKDGDIENIMESLTPDKTVKFIQRMMELKNHGTPFEHPVFTFGIEGVSRALSHQLVRHRIASFDQRSQRYCDEKQFEYVVPAKVAANPAAADIFRKTMEDINKAYKALVDQGVPREDARAVLPNACCTSLIMTMNLRSLAHFFSLRCCNRAQAEIREMANKMLELCRQVSPLIFDGMGAACKQIGYCPEGRMSCGAYPTLDKLLTAYREQE